LIHQLPGAFTASANGWRYCVNCDGLVWAARTACAAGGVHVPPTAFDSVVPFSSSGFTGQSGWR